MSRTAATHTSCQTSGKRPAGHLTETIRGTGEEHEAGQVVIIVALMMVVLLGIVALAIDAGDLFAQQRDLQTAADSGALAGALALAHGEDWEGEAGTYVDENRTQNPNLDPGGVSLTEKLEGPADIGRDAVRVTLREDGVPLFFAPFLDVNWDNGGAVAATATAEIKALITVGDLFPIMGKYYIQVLRVKVRPVGTPAGSSSEITLGELTEGPPSAGYATWEGDFTAPPTGGYWYVTLEAVDTEQPANVYARWADISVLNVRDPASIDPYVYDLERPLGSTLDSSTVTVKIAAPDDVMVSTVTSDSGAAIIIGSQPLQPGWNLWTATISPNPAFRQPPYCNQTDSYRAVSISFRTRRLPPGPPDFMDYNDVARFPDFHTEDGEYDVPVTAFSMPTTITPAAPLGVEVTAKSFAFRQYFKCKISSNINDTAGGTRNSANVWKLKIYEDDSNQDGVNLDSEIVDGFSPDSGNWKPFHKPLQIGNKLDYDNGATVGLVTGGWNERYVLSGFNKTYRLGEGDFSSNAVPDIAANDPNYIIVPIVYYRNLDEDIHYRDSRLGDITLTAGEYRIAMFAGLYVTEDPTSGNNGTIGGYFIRSLAEGEWGDIDPDEDPDLYVETVVLTK